MKEDFDRDLEVTVEDGEVDHVGIRCSRRVADKRGGHRRSLGFQEVRQPVPSTVVRGKPSRSQPTGAVGTLSSAAIIWRTRLPDSSWPALRTAFTSWLSGDKPTTCLRTMESTGRYEGAKPSVRLHPPNPSPRPTTTNRTAGPSRSTSTVDSREPAIRNDPLRKRALGGM